MLLQCLFLPDLGIVSHADVRKRKSNNFTEEIDDNLACNARHMCVTDVVRGKYARRSSRGQVQERKGCEEKLFWTAEMYVLLRTFDHSCLVLPLRFSGSKT